MAGLDHCGAATMHRAVRRLQAVSKRRKHGTDQDDRHHRALEDTSQHGFSLSRLAFCAVIGITRYRAYELSKQLKFMKICMLPIIRAGRERTFPRVRHFGTFLVSVPMPDPAPTHLPVPS